MFATTYENTEMAWAVFARCREGGASMLPRFFSEQLDDIAHAKEFCGACPVRQECLAGALERREPWGVWGGELFANGKILANKRRRGRPCKVRDTEAGAVVIDADDIREQRSA